MKKIISDFLNLFANSLVVISLILSSFLLLANLYHYLNISQKYYNNVKTNVVYQNFKSNISNAEKMITDINTDKISDQKHKMLAKTVEGQFTKCFSLVKESELYKSDNKTYVSYKDVYNYNDYLMSELQNQCVFLINYNINSSIKSYGPVNNNYDVTSNYILLSRNSLINYSNYIKNRLLANSSYSFITDSTKNSIFNELGDTYNLTLSNYDELSNLINTMASWYSTEFGGNK